MFLHKENSKNMTKIVLSYFYRWKLELKLIPEANRNYDANNICLILTELRKILCILEHIHDNMNMSEGMKESLRCFEVFKGVKYPYMVKC